MADEASDACMAHIWALAAAHCEQATSQRQMGPNPEGSGKKKPRPTCLKEGSGALLAKQCASHPAGAGKSTKALVVRERRFAP
ncbi:MAG: hypothetical protein U1E43_02315 [Rhodospirillales bacterium]